MAGEYTFWGVQKAGLNFLKENFVPIFKRLALPLFAMLFGFFVVYGLINGSFGVIDGMNPLGTYQVIGKTTDLNSKIQTPTLGVGFFINLILAAVLIIIATWKTLLVCLEIIYALKSGEKIQDLTIYTHLVKKSEKAFLGAMGRLALLYSYFTLIPYIIFLGAFLVIALVSNPLYGLYLIPVFMPITWGLFIALLVVSAKTFIILQIFVLEEDLEPKNIIKRCFNLVKGGNFWFIFGLFFICAVISHLPVILLALSELIPAFELISFIFAFILAFILTVVYLVAGFCGYKKFTSQEV